MRRDILPLVGNPESVTNFFVDAHKVKNDLYTLKRTMGYLAYGECIVPETSSRQKCCFFSGYCEFWAQVSCPFLILPIGTVLYYDDSFEEGHTLYWTPFYHKGKID